MLPYWCLWHVYFYRRHLGIIGDLERHIFFLINYHRWLILSTPPASQPAQYLGQNKVSAEAQREHLCPPFNWIGKKNTRRYQCTYSWCISHVQRTPRKTPKQSFRRQLWQERTLSLIFNNTCNYSVTTYVLHCYYTKTSDDKGHMHCWHLTVIHARSVSLTQGELRGRLSLAVTWLVVYFHISTLPPMLHCKKKRESGPSLCRRPSQHARRQLVTVINGLY